MTDTLNNTAVWEDQAAATPPSQFSPVIQDGRYLFASASAEHIAHIGTAALPASMKLQIEIIEAPATGTIYLQYDLAAGGEAFVDIGVDTGYQTVTITDHDTDAGDFRLGFGASGASAYQGLANGGQVAVREVLTNDFNIEYEVDDGACTLLELRQELLTRNGYGAQLVNLPPGVEALYNSYLQDAQKQLFRKYRAVMTCRLFTFQLVAGERFYDLRGNVDDATVRLDRQKIDGVWIQDLNNRWYPLARGIDPSLYTIVENQGWPSRFEIAQGLEIFPTPQAPYKARVAGDFGLLPFAADADYTTIDCHPILLWALGLAKNDKKMGSGGDPVKMTGYFGMARAFVLELIGNQHRGRRYVPGASPAVERSQPTLIEFIE